MTTRSSRISRSSEFRGHGSAVGRIVNRGIVNLASLPVLDEYYHKRPLEDFVLVYYKEIIHAESKKA